MRRSSAGRERGSDRDPESRSSENDSHFKSHLRNKSSKGFLYYEDSRPIKFVFFQWINKWAYLLFKQYVEPYMLHPLPVCDQILYWQPIFSKHVTNGLIRSEYSQASRSDLRDSSERSSYKSVLLRALFLTFWRRSLFVVLAIIATNVLSMSIAILFKPLLQILNNKSTDLVKTLLLLFFIIFFNLVDGLLIDNLNFYIFRLIYIVHYLFSIGIFQHGMSHTRKPVSEPHFNAGLKVCNEVVHSCLPGSECSNSPLHCPARRHQNNVRLKVFSLEFNDSYNISLFFESIKYIIEFLSNLIYGVFLLSVQMKANLWTLYSVGASFVLFMIFVELVSTYTLDFIFCLRDYRKTKCTDIFGSLPLVKKMLYDDIAINIINQCRNNELSLFLVRGFLSFFNMTLYTVSINISFYIIQRYFVASINNASVVSDIDTAGSMVTFYIFLKIISSMFLIPRAIRIFGMSYVSFKMLDKYVRDCPPNFYISDKFSSGASSALSQMTNRIPNDVVVYYKDATFTWVNSRENLLNKNYEPYLKNINFELKRGEIAIVTGSEGSGKSNFIKSMLGEMTLVGGSMAVVPLHTSMPIFYASQDVWLQQGTIRSNITFGYRFDEHLYNTVLKAVELEYDISTWEKGDLRVVSDSAPSLNRGQRVRIEMARAVYAYLVFHKVNKEYNSGKCSFLMCLDSSLQYPDPFLSLTIFSNLFNLKTGLLVMEDLSVVFSSTKRSLDLCSKFSDLSQLPSPPIYNIKDRKLTFYSNLHDFIRNKSNNSGHYKYFTSNYKGPHYLSFLSSDMLRLCSSACKPKFARIELTRTKHGKLSQKDSKDDLGGDRLHPFKAYMTPALGTFTLFFLITLTIIVMDNVKYVFATNLSDYIAKSINRHNNGSFIDMAKIKSRSNFSLKMTTLFVSLIVVLSVLSTIFMTTFSIVSSRKIHEYCVISIFKNSSSVIKIKKDIGQVLTYLSSDTKIIDEDVGYNLTLFLIYLFQTLINILTLFYLIPISIPFVIVTFIIVYKFVLLKLINYSKNIHFAYLESTTQMNSICESAISGSSIYRSFKKESELITNVIEQADYKMRCRFLFRSVLIWASVLFNWIFSFTTLFSLVVLLFLDKFTRFKLRICYFGFALSLSLTIIKSFDKFSLMYSKFKISIASVYKFRNFVPPGEKIKFDKFVNTHEEYLVSPTNRGASELDETELLRRRAIEFKTDNRKFYRLKKLFYHPKITILDVVHYLTPEHSRVSLKNVFVYTAPDHSPESMILKNVTVSAHKSEVVGIVGKTGAGKTTLLSVLQNIVHHRTGQVQLDGKDLNKIPKLVLRQVIGVIPQMPFVFRGWTLRRFLDPRKLFADDDITKALDKCGLSNFVNNLPGGKRLDTVMVRDEDLFNPNSNSVTQFSGAVHRKPTPNGFNKSSFEGGMLFSNIQIRTLLFARLVLYRHFYRMIVIDEPPEEDLLGPAANGYDLGAHMYELLPKFFSHCTTFVTAHDANVLKNCTSVWVIHEGRLVRTCKTRDLAPKESIATIIEETLELN